MRASDRDREVTVAALRHAYTVGRLDLNELCDRAGAAYAAPTWGDLRVVTADLPGGPEAGLDFRPDQEDSPVRARPAGEPGRPFAPMRIMGIIWLAIASAAPIPLAAIPLGLLALFALWAACWKVRE